MITKLQFTEVKELILAVGEYIRTERAHFNAGSVEHKDVHDMVSYVDKNAEQKIIEGLKKIIPDSSFLAEETGVQKTSSAYRWIIDPLDGTTNFIHHIPHFCISVALQFKQETMAAWVYEICTEELYTALKGEGAFINKQSIKVSSTKELQQSLMATGFPVRKYENLGAYMQLQQWVIENTRGVRRLGTAAYDLCLVAGGRVEAFYEPGLSPWDVAAGSLIVQEAGGKVSDFSGGNDFLFGGSIVATNGNIHAELLKVVTEKMRP
jgi:myo-inositol-1(or 4)-monophosphatase